MHNFWKKDVYRKAFPYVPDKTAVVTNELSKLINYMYTSKWFSEQIATSLSQSHI